MELLLPKVYRENFRNSFSSVKQKLHFINLCLTLLLHKSSSLNTTWSRLALGRCWKAVLQIRKIKNDCLTRLSEYFFRHLFQLDSSRPLFNLISFFLNNFYWTKTVEFSRIQTRIVDEVTSPSKKDFQYKDLSSFFRTGIRTRDTSKA